MSKLSAGTRTAFRNRRCVERFAFDRARARETENGGHRRQRVERELGEAASAGQELCASSLDQAALNPSFRRFSLPLGAGGGRVPSVAN